MWEKIAWGPTQKIDPIFQNVGGRQKISIQLKYTNEFTI